MMATRWENMTVAELRKYAREHKIPLSAGINKQGIVERLMQSEEAPQMALEASAAEQPAPADQPAEPAEEPQRPARRAAIIVDDDDESHEIGYGLGGYTRPAPERPRYSSDPVRPQPAQPSSRSADVLSTISSKAPAFHIDTNSKAWHNPRSFQQTNYHAPQQPGQAGTHTTYAQRTNEPARVPAARPSENRPAQRTATQQPQRFGPGEALHAAEPAQPGMRGEAAPDMMPSQEPARGMGYPYARTTVQPPALRDYQSLGKPAVNELLAQDESIDAQGVCVLLADGAGYLYPDEYLDDESIICLSAAQVRRFQLRSGDLVSGKVRARREGDKYRFMLYVTAINEIPVDDVKNRVGADSLRVMMPAKKLTALPVRNEAGEKGEPGSVAIQYGHRVYVTTGQTSPLKAALALGKQIRESKPGARVMTLSVQDAPEEAAMFRAAASWPLYAADQASTVDKQRQVLRLAADRAARLAEQKLDAVIIISHPNPSAELPEGLREALTGLLAAGRAFKEGGSVTVILLGTEEPDSALIRASSLRLTLQQREDAELTAADGSVTAKNYQIFV